jgi:hydroxymethylbilane synthase
MKVKIGTRGSALALWQANWVKDRLESRHQGLSVELVKIKTKGDKILDTALAKVGGKGLFVKEIEDALIRRETDLAVHSMKDVPAELPEGLIIDAIPEREDVRDAFIAREVSAWKDLPHGAHVGTSSLRRQSQLLHLRPDLVMIPLRGNVETRLRKLETENLDAVVLAVAGIKRMKLEDRITEYLSDDIMLPAIGQGALALEVREDDREMRELIRFLKHPATETAMAAERSFLRTLQGGCQVPIAALARVEGDKVRISGLVADTDGSRVFRDSAEGAVEDAARIGSDLAARILDQGAGEILERLLEAEL